MKIVLAIDGSDFSEAAVKGLAKMPLPNDSEVNIINIYEHRALPEQGLASSKATLYKDPEDAINNAEIIGKKIVSKAVELLKRKTDLLTITTTVVNGLPKRGILEKAESFDADLIVVGSQGQGAFSRFLLGSVSQYLATHAKCSVMIVKDKNAN